MEQSNNTLVLLKLVMEIRVHLLFLNMLNHKLIQRQQLVEWMRREILDIRIRLVKKV